MTEASQKINIPEPPALLPENLKAKWRKDYESGYLETFRWGEMRTPDRERIGLRKANAVLSVPEVHSYAEAKALADWQVVLREEAGGVLKVVTIDARKYSFPVPGKQG